MNILTGHLFSKLAKIKSKSEGPIYFLQEIDFEKGEILGEVVVIKQAELWEEDSQLQIFLGKKVSIEGESTPDGISYKAIGEFTY